MRKIARIQRILHSHPKVTMQDLYRTRVPKVKITRNKNDVLVVFGKASRYEQQIVKDKIKLVVRMGSFTSLQSM